MNLIAYLQHEGVRPASNSRVERVTATCIYTRADTGGGIGDCPPPEQFQGGDCPPPENCPPPEQFRGGTAKMSPP